MLKNLSLKPVYDSSENDLFHDLINPLLENSILYTRGVGFFTSGWLKVASNGIIKLIENNGKAKIICSPLLNENDWKAIQAGYESKENEILKEILKNNLTDIKINLDKDTLNCLAWMIADDVLEIKFAIPKDKNSRGEYHDKVGIFFDVNNDVVAIHGSLNDSIKGSLNGEAFSVFCSWIEGQEPYIRMHKNRLENLWNFGNQQFKAITIPESIKNEIIHLRSSPERPYKLPFSSRPINKKEIKIRDYQKEAVKAWNDANCQGIFEMATGTGKTITSLYAAVQKNRELGTLALVILVPYLHLVEQWQKECLEFDFAPILCSSQHLKWKEQLLSKIQDFNLNILNNICVIAVHQTSSSKDFKEIIKKLNSNNTMIIADEVHRLGSSKLRDSLSPNIHIRLGLSATPHRWFDEEGTNIIFSYFRNICFEFSLEKAIEDNYLVGYEYYPQLVNLNSIEMEEYENISQKIATLINMEDKTDQIENKLKYLYLERSKIIATAENKILIFTDLLNKLIDDYKKADKELRDILVYCAPGTHKEVLKLVANLGLRCREFVHTVPLNEREKILNDFKKGEIQVLVSMKCLDEGVDVPSTRIAFFLASTTNPREFVQRRGRVLRLSDGKNKSLLYDFLVVPPKENYSLKREVDIGLLKREMPRFAEFSYIASNQYAARKVVFNILNNYGLLHLLDEKPWDVYHELKALFEDENLLREEDNNAGNKSYYH